MKQGFLAFFPVDRAPKDVPLGGAPRQLSMHTRLALVVTALVATLLLVLAGLWLHGTRAAIHEEIEAATRVSSQMLRTLTRDVRDEATLLEAVRPLGRIRAHELDVLDGAGVARYVSPPSKYKAGRKAPDWFAALVAEDFPEQRLTVTAFTLVLRPDASRAALDAWDDLVASAGWAALGLALLALATRQALVRALRPLDDVMTALDRTGAGRFDTRLPVFAPPELARLSRAFNGMADRLQAAVDDNVRLETEREVAERMQARLEAERADIARELHDELAQGITAVRALAGAIVQRGGDVPAVHAPAQAIGAVTGEMQEGVRRILQRLQPPARAAGEALNGLLDAWRLRHADIALNATVALGDSPLPPAIDHALLRAVQEGLTNVVRHASATRVDLTIRREAGQISLRLADNGQGRGASAFAGSGFGLRAMGERVGRLGGWLHTERAEGGGFVLSVQFPEIQPAPVKEPA